VTICRDCLNSTAGVCLRHSYTTVITVTAIDPEFVEDDKGMRYIRFFWQGAEMALVQEWRDFDEDKS
jgi:hypothetical protein